MSSSKKNSMGEHWNLIFREQTQHLQLMPMIHSLNADTTMTLICPTINLSGNANVSNGLDVTGSITCSSILDIEGNIDMANARRFNG